ncbi:hypothetical protein DPX16_9623 [Anabarilius grahami]|uniref:Uncharacterized protein n=1 Tax=Anabarilius grahami TaxID=495550 RepID=A0A3N0Y3C3_ANAGA|nr:hypothetical protein DPX16_9623 [Anabarilius grahami]
MNLDGCLFDKQQVNDSDADDGIVDGWMIVDGVNTGWSSEKNTEGKTQENDLCLRSRAQLESLCSLKSSSSTSERARGGLYIGERGDSPVTVLKVPEFDHTVSFSLDLLFPHVHRAAR